MISTGRRKNVKRYNVVTETASGYWVNVYSGNSESRARSSFLFWNDKCPTKYVDTLDVPNGNNGFRYAVEVESRNGTWELAYESDSSEKAIKITDEIDEFRNVRFLDRIQEQVLAAEKARREQEVYEALPVQAKLDALNVSLQANVESAFKDAMATLSK